MSKKEMIVGIDVGTTKSSCIIGEIKDEGSRPYLEIIGLGSSPSTGLRKGMVINIDATVESIAAAVRQAEAQAGVKINHAYVGIAGTHIQSFNSSGVVAVKDKEIRLGDIQRVIDGAQAVAIPKDREIVHVMPQEYVLDEQDGIRDPIGMSGVRLEARVHIVTGAAASIQNVVKCVQRAGIPRVDVCLEPIASGEAVLTADEKDMGVALVDIGGGTTDLAVFREGSIAYTSVLPVGGQHLTGDISVGLRTPQKEAERIKIASGCSLAALVDEEQMIEVGGAGGQATRMIARRYLAQIIEPRVEEIFNLVKKELTKSRHSELLSGGVVITGGTSLLEGMPELAEHILDLPVKRGRPLSIRGLPELGRSPQFATGIGLVLYGAKQSGLLTRHQQKTLSIKMGGAFYEKMRSSVGSWMKDLF